MSLLRIEMVHTFWSQLWLIYQQQLSAVPMDSAVHILGDGHLLDLLIRFTWYKEVKLILC